MALALASEGPSGKAYSQRASRQTGTDAWLLSGAGSVGRGVFLVLCYPMTRLLPNSPKRLWHKLRARRDQPELAPCGALYSGRKPPPDNEHEWVSRRAGAVPVLPFCTGLFETLTLGSGPLNPDMTEAWAWGNAFFARLPQTLPSPLGLPARGARGSREP